MIRELKLVAVLPFGKPFDFDELSFMQQMQIAEHQYTTKAWRRRVQDKEMTRNPFSYKHV